MIRLAATAAYVANIKVLGKLEKLENQKAGAGSKFLCRQKIFTYTCNWKCYKYVTELNYLRQTEHFNW